MGAKLKSKTHLPNTFFDFLSCYLRVSKFSRSANMTKKYISKNTEFHADFESVVKLLKNAPKKVISKTRLKNMRKSKNSAYFHHIFASTFFMHF
jgi:hypothetical protein